MGIPTAAFRAGDLYIEYGFEDVLYRYEKETGRFFCKSYNSSRESEVPHDSKLLCEARCSGVLTTAERYFSEGAFLADRTGCSFSRTAVKYQRIRPYWLSVMHLKNYACSGDIEVGASGGLEVVKAVDQIRERLEAAVADINSQSCLEVACGNEAPVTVDRKSRDYDFALRLELTKRELTIFSESSFYLGRSQV